MAWYEKTGASVLLRLAGLGMVTIACFTGAALRSRAAAGGLSSDPAAYLLAAAAFLCASVGGMLTALGSHIFDKVEISRRWSRIDRS
jgi:hypothetical protein